MVHLIFFFWFSELEQAAALKYLYSWLRHHPKYGTVVPPDQPDSLYYADVRLYMNFCSIHISTNGFRFVWNTGFTCGVQVARLFNDAAKMSPDDADVHIVLGVLYNLSREYDKAIESFQTALKLKPRDYSLWNKLGATQANSVQSAEAITAYQQAIFWILEVLHYFSIYLFMGWACPFKNKHKEENESRSKLAFYKIIFVKFGKYFLETVSHLG